MSGSSQKFIARNRAPRVQIEYDVELYGAEKKIQLPFVMGVMSDLSGMPADPLAPVPALGKFPPVQQLLPKIDICGFVITLADGVLFDFDKDNIRPDAAATLDKVATALNGNFLPAATRAATTLKDGDALEVVAPMQGG